MHICRRWVTDKVTVHDPDYRAAQNDFSTFLEALSEKIIEADETIPELPVKDIVRASSKKESDYLPITDIQNLPRFVF